MKALTAFLGFALVVGIMSKVAALSVESDFEGASVKVLNIHEATQTIRFMPGGNPERGWPCWWHFRITGLDASKPLLLELQGSDALMPGQTKPLHATWAMPERAALSLDGRSWQQTSAGILREGLMCYELKLSSNTLQVAWGPPYSPAHAASLVQRFSAEPAIAEAGELCHSREGRSVPMLRIYEGDRVEARRFGVWVQARQHAWESGSSWVCQGFAEWLMSSDAEAAWLRQHGEIYLIPIMDVDNTATGNGGKDELPQDHNRDWQPQPHWAETAAAQRMIGELVKDGRMDVFLDLHNPSHNDKKAFFYALPNELLKEPMLSRRDQFMKLATASIGAVFPMSDEPKHDGPKYSPLWRQISGTWVSLNANSQTVALCLETPWNIEQSTTTGYREVGAALAKAVQQFLQKQPLR
jgi:hypothetical protein